MPSRLACLAATAVLATAPAAHAQRPVITQNTDEPGRSPYQVFDSKICFQGRADLRFGAVPAGKRLVLTYATGLFFGNPGAELVYVDITEATSSKYLARIFLPFATVASLDNGRQFAATIEAYVDAADIATVTMDGCRDGSSAEATLAGYLISVP